jgi:hypothetical protein
MVRGRFLVNVVVRMASAEPPGPRIEAAWILRIHQLDVVVTVVSPAGALPQRDSAVKQPLTNAKIPNT